MQNIWRSWTLQVKFKKKYISLHLDTIFQVSFYKKKSYILIPARNFFVNYSLASVNNINVLEYFPYRNKIVENVLDAWTILTLEANQDVNVFHKQTKAKILQVRGLNLLLF